MFTPFARNALMALAALGLLTAGACGGSAAPTKDQLGKQLTELAAALESKDLDTAAEQMMLPPDRKLEEIKPMLPRLLEKNEISSAGVKLLLAKGEFGKLGEVFPEKGPKRAERVGVALGECWAFKLDNAEVMAHWTGGKFKIFRLDDVGKLKAHEGDEAGK